MPPPLARALGGQLLKALQVGGCALQTYNNGDWQGRGKQSNQANGCRNNTCTVVMCTSWRRHRRRWAPCRSCRAQAKAKAEASRETQE